MTPEAAAWIAIAALCLVALEGKRVSALQREVDLLVKGDTETILLKRKLDGRPED